MTVNTEEIGAYYWIDDFLDQYSEQTEQEYTNGVPRFEFRTREEKIANCGRAMYKRIGANGLPANAFEYRCHIITGEKPCRKCVSIREKQRIREFTARIKSVDESNLYVVSTNDKKGMNRLRKQCNRKGFDYLSFPDSNGGRVTIVNGQTGDSEPISMNDAISLVRKFSGFISEDGSLRVTGNLGKEKKDKKESDTVTVKVRGYGFIGSHPDLDTVTAVEAKLAEFIPDSIREEGITADNIQLAITERENQMEKLYDEVGYSVKWFAPRDSVFKLDDIKANWLTIEPGEVKVTGKLDSANPYLARTLSMAIDYHNGRSVPFSDSVDEAIRINKRARDEMIASKK